MPYYFAEVIDGPVRADGRITRVPAGVDSPGQRNWLYLRDRALLWASDPINDPRLVKIGDDGKERLSVATRAALRNLADDGRNFRATDAFDETIAGLLLNPVAGRWNALRPSKVRRRYEILLGPDNLLWTQFAAPTKNTKTFVDSFNRSNSTTLGTSSDGLFSWTELSGTTLAITSNQLTATNIPNGATLLAVTSADCDTDDVYAFINLVTFTRASGTDLDTFIGCGYASDGSSGYYLDIANYDDSATRGLYRGSDFAALDTDTTATTSGVLRVERDGSSIRGYVGGSLVLSATDSAEPSGAGFRRALIGGISGENSTNDLAWDNFGYGDLVAAGTNRRRRFLMAA